MLALSLQARDTLARMFKRKPDREAEREAERGAAWSKLNAAQQTLKSLEQQAGIREVMDALGLRASDTTEQTRRTIFGVTDIDLRRRIMQACRDCEQAHAALRNADNDNERYRLIIKTHARNRRSVVFFTYSAVTVGLVLIGQGVGHPWEIVGAAVGVIWAVVDMPGVEQGIASTIDEYKRMLADAEKIDAEWTDFKPLFSDAEIASGLRDSA